MNHPSNAPQASATTTQRWVVGVDIGGTKIEASTINNQGEVASTLRLPALPDNEAMLTRIVAMIDQLRNEKPIEGVGFSIPGSLDPHGVLRNAPNSPGIDRTSLAADLGTRLNLPTAFENDANCLALSEYHFGAARGYRHVVGIILGTGLGGGVLVDGKVLNGSRGLAPEPGHLPFDVNGRRCLCGNRGCAEAYLSGASVLRRYHDAGGDPIVSHTRTIFERSQDPIAQAIIEETAYLFQRFIATLVSLYDPEVFVLGGGLSLQEMFYRQTEAVASYCFGTDQVPPIVKAERGDASGKLGAAALILDTLARV